MQFASMNLGIIDSIISFFVTLFMNIVVFILNLVKYIFANLFYNIGKLIMEIADLIQSLFRKFAGLEPTWFAGEEREGDILLSMLSADSVQRVFLALTLVAIALILIFSIIQIIRTEYTTEGANNSKTKIFGNAIKGFVMFLVVPFAVFLGIWASNFILQALDNATSGGNKSNFSTTIFVSSMYNANRFRRPPFTLLQNLTKSQLGLSTVWKQIVQYSDDGDDHVALTNGARDFINAGCPGYTTYKDVSSGVDGTEAQGTYGLSTVAEKYLAFIYITARNNGIDVTLKGNDLTEDAETMAGVVDDLFRRGATVSDYVLLRNIDLLSAAQGVSLLAGDSVAIFSDVGRTVTPLRSAIVACFYSVPNCNFIILYGGGLFTIYCLLMAVFGLIMRLIKGTLYYMICPPLIGMYPIDGGSAFQSWRKKFVGMVLAAYGTIVSLNLMFIILPLIQNIQLFSPVWNPQFGSAASIMGGNAANYFVQLLITIVALFFFKDAPKMVSDFIGADDAMGEGKGMAKQVGGAIATTVMGGKNLIGHAVNRVQSKKLSEQYNDAQQKADAETDPAAKAALQAKADSLKQQAQAKSAKADNYGSALRAQGSKALSTMTGGLYQSKDDKHYGERRKAKIDRIDKKAVLANETDDAIQTLEQEKSVATDPAVISDLEDKIKKLQTDKTYIRAKDTRDNVKNRKYGAAGQAMENVRLAKTEAESKKDQEKKDQGKTATAKIESSFQINVNAASTSAAKHAAGGTDRVAMDNEAKILTGQTVNALSVSIKNNAEQAVKDVLAQGDFDTLITTLKSNSASKDDKEKAMSALLSKAQQAQSIMNTSAAKLAASGEDVNALMNKMAETFKSKLGEFKEYLK